MPDAGLPSVFISYSREDSAFADRLEADLRARGFRVWVDRRRLEGGQQWQTEIDRAIEQHQIMALVLSPASTNSPAVKHEYEYATTHNKQVVPVLLQDCTPHYAIPQQWIEDFLRRDYATGLKALLAALLFQQLSLTAPSRELYERATGLRGRSQVSDREQAAVMLQRILDREPGYLQGLVKGDLNQLTESLYPNRAQNLRQQAIAARRTGEYGVEASTLEALLALGHPDACAAEYLPLARQNSQFVDLYWVVQQQIAKGDLNDAKGKLRFLWSKAPYYRDPANVAPKLGLTLPRSYEEVKARKGAEEQRQREVAAAQTHHTLEQARLASTFETIRQQMAFGYTSSYGENTRAQIFSLLGAASTPDAFLRTIESTMTSVNQWHLALSGLRSLRPENEGALTFLRAFTFLFVAIVFLAILDFAGNYILFPANMTGLAFLSSILVFVLLLIFLFLATWSLRRLRKAKGIVSQTHRLSNEWYAKWQMDMPHEIDQRSQGLLNDFNRQTQAAQAQYQQRIQAIETTYRTSAATAPLLACWQRSASVS